MDYSEYRRLLMLILFIFCGYGFLRDQNLNINRGYSFLMGSGLYVIGGGICRFQDCFYKSYSRKRLIVLYLFLVVINTILVTVFKRGNFVDEYAWRLYSYNNPLVFIESLCFFLIVLCTAKKWNCITIIAKSTLAIYIIHSTCWQTRYRGIIIKRILTGNVLLDLCFLLLFALFIILVGTFYYFIFEKVLMKYIKKVSLLLSKAG